jgi:hypothetical protein
LSANRYGRSWPRLWKTHRHFFFRGFLTPPKGTTGAQAVRGLGEAESHLLYLQGQVALADLRAGFPDPSSVWFAG